MHSVECEIFTGIKVSKIFNCLEHICLVGEEKLGSGSVSFIERDTKARLLFSRSIIVPD